MLITASWKITLGGVTLLDFGELTNDECALSQKRLNDISPVIGADFQSIFPRKNVLNTLTFSRVMIHDSDNQARLFLLTHAVELPFGVTNDCIIHLVEGFPGYRAVIAGAVLQDDGYRSRTESQRFIAEYQIVGGEITFPTTGGGPVPSPGAPPCDHIVTEDGDFIVDESGNKLTT